MADDTRSLLAQTNTYSDDAVILRQEANKFIGEGITVTLETNRAIVEGSVGGGAGIVASFQAMAKVDDGYQPYNMLDIPFVEPTGDIILNDDNISMEVVKAGTYNLYCNIAPSGNGTTFGTTIRLYKNEEIILETITRNGAGNNARYITVDLEVGDIIKVYNNYTGWTTFSAILFFRG